MRIAHSLNIALGVTQLPAQAPGAGGDDSARPLVRDIAGAQRMYLLVLGRDQMVWAVADQQSVDVMVARDRPGRVAGKFTVQRVGRNRSASRHQRGRYRIELRPFEGASGRYAFAVERVEPVARTAAGRSIN